VRITVTHVQGRRAATVLLLFFLLQGCKTAGKYMQKGNDLFARGEFAEASLNYHKALQKDPTLGEAYYQLGLSDLKENKAPEALQDLQQAVRLMPANQAAKTELTNLALGAYIGDPKRPKFLYDLLVKWGDEWTKQDPHSLQGLRIQGYVAMLEQRPAEAAELLRRAHQYNPRDEKIVDGLMDALFRNNQPAEAEKAGLEFVAADKTAADVYDALYRLYQAQHRNADAEHILIRKAKDNPREGAYTLQLAAHYAMTQDRPNMDKAMQMFLANPGADPRVHLEAGDFFASLGDLPRAQEQYQAGAAANSKDKLLYLNRIARTLLLQNKRQEGLKVLAATIVQFPDDQEARALQAALLVGTPSAGKPGEGVQKLRGLLDKNPADLFLKFVLARGLLESGQLGEARTQLLEIVKSRPQFVDAHVLLATIAFQQGHMPETIQHAEAALEVDPNHLRARMLRGSALLQEGNLDQAAGVLNALAREVPQSVDVKLELAYLALKRRQFGEAEAAFKKILDSNPREWRAVSGLVDADLAQNRQDRALSTLEDELTRSHGAPAVRSLLASTALKTGRYNVAIENLRQLADQTSGSIDPHIQLADVYRLKGDVHNAISVLEKAALLQPKDPRPPALLPYLLEMENRAKEAKQVAMTALKRQPQDPVAMNNVAYLLAETGDSLDEALKLARAAVSKAPNNPVFLDTLGYVYLKRDQNDEALDIFGNLIRKYPDDPACAYHTGMAWFQKGDRAKAKMLLSHALDLRPSKDIEPGINELLSHVN